MSLPAKADALLEAVLKPLSGPKPAGPNLRESTKLNSFSKLQGVIKEDRRYQDKAGHEGTPANWADVRQRATAILQDESKDLEVAAWLVRALIKTDGFDGLGAGLLLICRLHAQLGDDLHPQDAELRRSRLEWLDQQLEMDLRAAIPVLDRSQPAQVKAMANAVKEQLAALATTVAELGTHYKDDPPSFSATRRAIDILASTVTEAGGDEATEAAAPASETGSATASALPRGGPRNREEALRMLEAVAAYFAAAEPLSPVPHLLRRAARWAKGSLQQWLDEMVVKDEMLEVIYKTLDMAKPVTKQ